MYAKPLIFGGKSVKRHGNYHDLVSFSFKTYLSPDPKGGVLFSLELLQNQTSVYPW